MTELLTIKQFAETYNVGRTKAYELLCSGQLPGRRLGRKVLIHRDDARQWAETLPVYTTAEARAR